MIELISNPESSEVMLTLLLTFFYSHMIIVTIAILKKSDPFHSSLFNYLPPLILDEDSNVPITEFLGCFMAHILNILPFPIDNHPLVFFLA